MTVAFSPVVGSYAKHHSKNVCDPDDGVGGSSHATILGHESLHQLENCFAFLSASAVSREHERSTGSRNHDAGVIAACSMPVQHSGGRCASQSQLGCITPAAMMNRSWSSGGSADSASVRPDLVTSEAVMKSFPSAATNRRSTSSPSTRGNPPATWG